MAKQKQGTKTPSLMDFNEENLLPPNLDPLDEELEEEEIEEEEEETPPVKKTKVKRAVTFTDEELEAAGKKKTKTPPAEEEEEEEEVETPPAPAPKPGEEEEEEDTDVAATFFQKVNEINGVEVEVDYGEVDPLSPQGIALRDQALMEKNTEEVLQKIAERYPQVYKALEYANAGGNIADLFAGDKDYSKVTIADDDETHARAVLTEYYEAKGITNPARIKRMIDVDAESDEGLVKVAQDALTEMVEEQNRQKQQKLADQQAQAEARRQQDQKFLSSVSEVIKGGKLDTFKIPQQEVANFYSFIRERVQRNGDNGYLLITPIDPAQLEKQLQVEYFRYKKGDLSKLIQIKAATAKTEDLRLRLKAEEKGPRSTVAPKVVTKSLQDLNL